MRDVAVDVVTSDDAVRSDRRRVQEQHASAAVELGHDVNGHFSDYEVRHRKDHGLRSRQGAIGLLYGEAHFLQ